MNKSSSKKVQVSEPAGRAAVLREQEVGWRGWMSRPAFISALLALITLAVYCPVLHHDFIFYDDNVYVTQNNHVLRGLTWKGVWWSFTNYEAGFWQPLAWLSFMLDVSLFGEKATGFHFTSLLLHTANAVLVFLLFRQLTGADWKSGLLAGLFALHPFCVEPVAWVASRKDVLSAFFSFLSLIVYVRYTQSKNRDSRFEIRNYILSLFFFVCALMTKTMVVTLPLMMLLLDWWPLNRISSDKCQVSSHAAGAGSGSRRWTLDRRLIWRLVWEKLPFFGAALVCGLVTIFAEHEVGALSSVAVVGIGTRIANAVFSYGRYILQTIWPVGLALPYPYPKSFPVMLGAGMALMVLAITVAAIRAARRQPFFVVGWFWFGLLLLPVIGLIQVSTHARADRYMYLPLLGLLLVLVWGGAELLGRWQPPRMIVGIISVLLLAACAVRTRDQLGYWQNTEKLFKHSLAVTPENFVPYAVLGDYHSEYGPRAEAIENYRKALELDPLFLNAMNNLGLVLLAEGRVNEAMKCYRKVLETSPAYVQKLFNVGGSLASQGELIRARQYVGALNNLGKALADQERLDEAMGYYYQALKIDPNFIEALNNLADALNRKGKPLDAIPLCEKALQENPNHAGIRYNLGCALMTVGRLDEAINHFEWALRKKPDFPEAHNNLGIALVTKGDLSTAEYHYTEALRLKSEYGEAHNNLGYLFMMQGKLAEAEKHFRESLRLDPKQPKVHLNLGNCYALQKRYDDAEEQFTETLQLTPENAQAHRNLGMALARLGRREEAIRHLTEALRLDPSNVQVREQLRTLGAAIE